MYIDFECGQNPFWKENSYRGHNTDMWNQEVFELFIAEGEAIPTRYLELEINQMCIRDRQMGLCHQRTGRNDDKF